MIIEIIGITSLGFYAQQRFQKKTLIKRLTTSQSRSRITPFMNDVRNQQIKEFSADNINQKPPTEILADRNMTIALTSMGFAAAGRLFYPPLVLLSLPGIVYITHFAVVHAYENLVEKKKLTVDFLSALTKILLVINGYLFFASFSIFLFSLNRKLLAKISDNSKKNIIDVFKQQPSFIWVLRDGVESEIAFAELQHGDIVVVSAGGTIPVDGYIAKGSAAIDQHILTGESQPVEKSQGTDVFAMTLVLSGKIYIHAQKTGQETTAAQIAGILNNTINTKTDIQLKSAEFGDKTVLPTLLLGGCALPFLGPIGSMAILNSHFKYRPSIASAIGVMNHLNVASHNGILVKDGHTFELLKKVDTFVFDKTGTLTEEQPRVTGIYAFADYTEQQILQYAAAAETKQNHPIAYAILQEASHRQLELPAVENADYKLGYGLTVQIDGLLVRVGSVRFLQQEGISMTDNLLDMQASCHENGSPVVAVAIGDVAVGVIILESVIRAGTRELIAELRDCGIQSMYIISGDHVAPTRKLAEAVGIENYFAETLPEQKALLIAELQAEGKVVCYVGDGINDSIALKQADVSVSIRGASTVATDTAQIVLMDKSLKQLPHLYAMGQQFGSHMQKILAAVILPSLLSAGGAIFLDFSLIQSLILPQIGLLAGVATAMQPAIKQQHKGKLLN